MVLAYFSGAFAQKNRRWTKKTPTQSGVGAIDKIS